MGEKSYFYTYSSNEKTSSGTEAPNNESELTHLETLILGCAKNEPKTEAKISKEVKTNLPIVSQIITELMLKGFMERTRRRRILFADKEYFSTTLEGLIALEHARRNTVNYTFFSQLFYESKDSVRRILEELTTDSIALKLVVGSLRLVFRIAKYALIR